MLTIRTYGRIIKNIEQMFLNLVKVVSLKGELGMNKVTLMGRLTKDPELWYTNATGKAVSNFTLAVTRRYGSSENEKVTDFLPVVSWGKLAEFCSEYFKKGM